MKFLKLSRSDLTPGGFTLIELLIAIVISGIVSTLISYGISLMVSSNQKLAIDQNGRVAINRGLNAIVYDIQIAQSVNLATTVPTTTVPTTTVEAAITASRTRNAFNPPLNPSETPVLYLELPGCNVPERVIYSIRAKSSGEQRRGPNIIYRYGRIATNGDGSIDCSSAPIASAAISDTILAPNIAPNIAPNCSSPAIKSGTSGFYSCVSDNQVSIAIFGQLSGGSIYGVNRTTTSGFVPIVRVPPVVTVPPVATVPACIVPNLLSTATTPALANTTITGIGLLFAGISIGSGNSSRVLTQTPSAGSTMPCGKGLVTYTY